MSKTVLIILAAVVVLIVIVVLTGMRYLRADDEDDFDGLPAERGRSAPDDLPAGRGRARGDDRDWPEAAGRPRDSREPAGRTGRGRTAHGRPARSSQPQRPGRSARRGQDDADKLVTAGSRSGRAPADRPGKRESRDYDDRPARSALSPREYEEREARSARPAGGARDPDLRAGRDDSGKRSSPRGNSRLDDRREDGAQSRRDESLPAVRPRQGRSKRDGDGEWPSNEWDELSDVDYWAELASDKPLTTTAQPAAAPDRPGRPEARRDPDPGPARNARPGGGARSEGARNAGARNETGSTRPARSGRQHPQADQAALAAPTGSGEFGGAGSRRPGVPGTEPTLAMLASLGPSQEGFRPPGPDDDPLTSPSFPRIGADDSRSYHRSRPEARSQDTRVPDGRGPDGSAQTVRFAGYQAAPPGKPGVSLDGPDQRGATPPGGYPRPTGTGADYAAAAASAADPYRSAPSATSGQHRYPIPPPSAETGGYPASGPVAGSGGYPAQAIGTGGYPAQVPGGRAGYPGDASTISYSAPSAVVSGYPADAAGAGGYPASASASHPAQAAGQGGYPAAISGGYLPQPARPASAGYLADASTGSYPAPAASAYPVGSVTGGYPAGRAAGPVPAEPLSYPGYSAGGLTSGTASPYLHNLDSGLRSAGSHGPALGSDDTGGYQGFPAGPAGQFAPAPAGGYPAQMPQLPGSAGRAGLGVGYSAGPAHPAEPDGYPDDLPAGQFYSAPYESAAAPEPGGYAGSDPYALDPYGYPGYRNGGF